jgi:hypothetical protein
MKQAVENRCKKKQHLLTTKNSECKSGYEAAGDVIL